MDAKRLSETKSMLKRRQSLDRSAPLVDDAAHPGSGGVMRCISAGHFDLKHHEIDHDASKPMLEPGTGFHTDIRPAVFAEVQTVKRNSLKHVEHPNDRSDPVIDKYPMQIQRKDIRKSLVEEMKEKRSTIEAMHTYNEHHAKSEIEKFTNPCAPRAPRLPTPPPPLPPFPVALPQRRRGSASPGARSADEGDEVL